MSGARILYPQFRDEQADSRYPFSDSATLVSTERQLDIGRDTFIDAAVYTIGGQRRAYISAIVVTPNLVTVRVGDAANKQRASANYNPLNPPADGLLQLFDAYARPAGILLSSPLALARFSGWPGETHTFASTATEFVSSVVIPAQEPGVRGLQTGNGAMLTGDVWLVGGRGVTLRVDTDGAIRIDINGEPLFSRILCETVGKFQPQNVLQLLSVNGVQVGPDDFGNFTITATGHEASDTVLRISEASGSIKIDTVGRKVV